MKHQISIVGSQLLPIYIGIKEFKPDKVHFIVSNESIASLAALFPLLNTVQHSEYKCNAFDFFEIKSTCEKILSKIDPKDSVSFNLTGGTKIMLLACQAMIIEKGLNGFYINQDDSLIELSSFTKRNINTELTTKDFFDLSGHKLSSFNLLTDFTIDDFKMASTIDAFANRDKRYSTITNYLKKKYSNQKQKIPSSGKELISNNIEIIWNSNSLTIKENGKDLLFLKSKYIISLFFNSSWWELQVATEINKWSAIKELFLNCVLPFKTDGQTIKNEIDILVNTGKKLVFVECKSGIILPQDINKMKAIKQTYGGLISKSILVSRFIPSPTIIEKCKELDIAIFYCYAYQNKMINSLNKVAHKLSEIHKIGSI